MILRINRFSPVHFWARVAQGEGCWEWQGATRHGYGVLNRQGHAERAHRISWELTYGPIPDGLVVCHRCDNPPCCRPDHLFLGTVADNSADMYAKGRGNTGDRNGMRRHPAARQWGNRYGALHPERRARGEQVKSAVLTADQVRAIRARHRAGIGYRRLAREFGVHRRTIWAIVKRINWGWLEDAA
jgi:predicted DNA-binding protein (UPF0251 family)